MSNDGNDINDMTVPTIDDLKKKLSDLREKLSAEFPNHCRTCGGNGGHVIYYPGSRWEPDFYEFDYCGDCSDKGKDPLNTNLNLLEDDVSPITGEPFMDHPLLGAIRSAEEDIDYHPYGEDDN